MDKIDDGGLAPDASLHRIMLGRRRAHCAIVGHDWTETVRSSDVSMEGLAPLPVMAMQLARRLDALVHACKRCDLTQWWTAGNLRRKRTKRGKVK